MKRTAAALFIQLTLVLLMLGSAHAKSAISPDAAALFQRAYPSHRMTHSDQCGPAAAAVLWDGETQVICLAEERNGAWELVVSNPAALRDDAAVTSLLLDTDETLFWSYKDGTELVTYHAVRTGGQWRVTGMMSSEDHGNGNISEYHMTYEDGCLHYSTCLCDENDNLLSSRSYAPVPAAWLEELMPLSIFDDARFSRPDNYYTHSWLPKAATVLAAEELFPGDTFLGGCAKQTHLEFFLQRPDGERIMAICRFSEEKGWRITLSTPLPEGTFYGWENFSSSLVIGNLLVDIGPVDEDVCGVTFICNTTTGLSEETIFSLGRNWIASQAPNGFDHCFGNHPWGDIAVIDWSSLPHSFEEALALLDTSDWAVVNNPNPADRLHLRTGPERAARSLGKYYNGTPVRILETRGSWAHVDVFGVTGWMMKEDLAFGSAAHAVEAAFPARMPVESKTDHFVYASPEARRPLVNQQQLHRGLLVLAVVGDDWYHVWFPDENLTGYVLQSDWWEGNG